MVIVHHLKSSWSYEISYFSYNCVLFPFADLEKENLTTALLKYFNDGCFPMYYPGNSSHKDSGHELARVKKSEIHLSNLIDRKSM